MRVLHLAAGNRWTGAAAPAFAEVAALREAGVDAHYAYVGGYKLEAKLAACEFAHPIIEKAQNPLSFARTIRAIDTLVADHAIDIIHAHLTYDHWLGLFVLRKRRGVRLARTFHSRRVLRNEPLTRFLVSRTGSLFVINDALAAAPLVRSRRVTYTPPPLDTAEFSPAGPDMRRAYGIAADAPLVMAIGKLSKGRGFEAVLQTFAIIQKTRANARLMIIGHGEHRPALEEIARSLDVSPIWAGYHEDDLAAHYRSADVLLFTSAGSDEGHRAVIEAMGCGVAPATYPLDGMRALLGNLAPGHSAEGASPDALARTTVALFRRNREDLRSEVTARAQAFTLQEAARRLIDGYSTAR